VPYRRQRQMCKRDRANRASLGNVVPHLHWHVIARFDWDARWPAPLWAARQREVVNAEQRLAMPLAQLDQEVIRALQSGTRGN